MEPHYIWLINIEKLLATLIFLISETGNVFLSPFPFLNMHTNLGSYECLSVSLVYMTM